MLSKEINKARTCDNAKKFLSEYRRCWRLSSPTPTTVFSKIANRELAEMDKALEFVTGRPGEVLKQRYLDIEEKDDIEIYMELNISDSTYYRDLQKGHLQFMLHYKEGAHIVYKE